MQGGEMNVQQLLLITTGLPIHSVTPAHLDGPQIQWARS